MKSITSKILAAAAAAFLCVSSSSALTLTLTHATNATFNQSSTTLTRTFDLTASPTTPSLYNPATQQVNSAKVSFGFTNIGDDTKFNLDINLGLSDFYNATNVQSNFNVPATSIGVTALADLSADGKLTYTITATSLGSGECFTLDWAKLEADVGTRNSNAPLPRAPDGGSTALLLGTALATLGLVARRRKS